MSKGIVIVGPVGSTQGGVATIVYNLLADPRLREDFTVYTLDTTKRYPRKIIHRSFYFGNFIGVARQMLRLVLLLRFRPIDVVQLYTTSFYSFEKNKLFVRLCTMLGKKVVLDVHGGAFDSYAESLSPRKKAAAARMLRSADAIRVVLEGGRRQSRRECI